MINGNYSFSLCVFLFNSINVSTRNGEIFTSTNNTVAVSMGQNLYSSRTVRKRIVESTRIGILTLDRQAAKRYFISKNFGDLVPVYVAVVR
jgi:hypothetical protein